MNKYTVIRHIDSKDGLEATRSSFVCDAISPEQAISRTRYSNTRTNKHPNGEPTDYVNERGEHIYWTAELIPEVKGKAPDLDDETLEDALANKPAQVHVIATGKNAERFNEIKKELGIKKNTAVFAEILNRYTRGERAINEVVTNGEVFILPAKTREDAIKYAKLCNCKVEDLYNRAVKYYLTRLGKMTLDEYLKAKEEAEHGNA